MAKLISHQPGYRFTLPPGLKYHGKTSVLFPTKEPSLLFDDVKDAEVLKFVMASEAFKKSIIEKVPTPEEIALAIKVAKQEEQRKFYQELAKNPAVVLNFAQMHKEELAVIAESIGVSTQGNVVDHIEKAVFGEVKAEKKAPVKKGK